MFQEAGAIHVVQDTEPSELEKSEFQQAVSQAEEYLFNLEWDPLDEEEGWLLYVEYLRGTYDVGGAVWYEKSIQRWMFELYDFGSSDVDRVCDFPNTREESSLNARTLLLKAVRAYCAQPKVRGWAWRGGSSSE